MPSYEQALQELYQAPLADFVAERKRLAAALRAQGEEAAAAEIVKRAKPPTSVWVINQLYRKARGELDALLAAAARVGQGDRSAAPAYRDGIASLRKRAARILLDAGHGASEETLRRASTTLAAIAAAGGFEPDPPGALSADRDPPGFEMAGTIAAPPPGGTQQSATAERAVDSHDRERERNESRLRAAEEARSRAAEERERKQREALERARRKAERARLQTELRTAMDELRMRERLHAQLEQQLRDADLALRTAAESVKEIEGEIAKLEEPE